MCSLLIHDCHVNPKSFFSKEKRPWQFSRTVAGSAFKSSYVKGKLTESQIPQGWLPAIKLTVVILFPCFLWLTEGSRTLEKGTNYLFTYT